MKIDLLNSTMDIDDQNVVRMIDDPELTLYYDENGKCHREDGPAYIMKDRWELWFWRGSQIRCNSQKEFERLLKLKAFW